MIKFDYAAADVPVRQNLTTAHQMAWNSIASPGRWWDGSQRIAIAGEARNAIECTYCASRKEALWFTSVQGKHLSSSDLPDGAIEAVHRIVSDPARLTEIC